MEYNSAKIGERIKAIRQENNLSQDAFLERCKMSMKRSRLCQIEKGNDMYFSFDFLLKIAENFNCDIGYLLGEYDEKTREIHEICLATGLTQAAVENIIEWKKGDLSTSIDRSYEQLDFLRSGNVESFVDTINSLIVSPDFPMFLNNIILYQKAVLEFQKTENELIDVRKRFENDIDWINETIDEYDEKGLFDKKELIDLYLFRMQDLIKNITRNIAKEGAENG